MPNKKRKNVELTHPQKIYRFMSVDELSKVLLGKQLINTTDWSVHCKSTGHGFCFLEKTFTGHFFSEYEDFSPYTKTWTIEDFKEEWKELALLHFRNELYSQCNLFQSETDVYLNSVVVEFINKGQKLDKTIGGYNSLGTIHEYCTTSYSKETLQPVRFSMLSSKHLKWRPIRLFQC